MVTEANAALEGTVQPTATEAVATEHKKQRPYTVGYVNRRRLTDLVSRGFNYVDLQGREVANLRLNMPETPIHLYRNPEPGVNLITIEEARNQVDICTRMFFAEQRKEQAPKQPRPAKQKSQPRERKVNPNSPFAALATMSL